MKTKTAVIILANRVNPEDKGSLGRLCAQVANIVARAVVKQPYSPPLDTTHIAKTLINK